MRAVKREQEEVSYDGVAELFEGPDCKLSEFQKRVCRILRVGRLNNVLRDPYMFLVEYWVPLQTNI